MKTNLDAPLDALDCATFDSSDEYAQYFNHLCTVFSRLVQCYHSDTETNYEIHSIHIYLKKFLYTVEVLRKKYTYNPAHSLKVDLTDSGFPNFLEISYLSVDLLNRQKRLIALPPGPMLKQAMLDYMFKHRAEPKEYLWQMSEREYYEMLDEKKLFLAFTPGRLELRNEGPQFRSYVFSWACYDFRTNRPYIHIMTFDQDMSAEPLQWKGASYLQFLDVVRSEGSRVPEIGVLALALDEYLESIHPKVLKRICVGPLHSTQTCAKHDSLCGLLTKHSRDEQDFILLMKDEIVFSERQETREANAFGPKRVREIFYIPEADLDLYEHKASRIHRYMLMPHHVLQQMQSTGMEEYAEHKKLTFDKEGRVHGA